MHTTTTTEGNLTLYHHRRAEAARFTTVQEPLMDLSSTTHAALRGHARGGLHWLRLRRTPSGWRVWLLAEREFAVSLAGDFADFHWEDGTWIRKGGAGR